MEYYDLHTHSIFSDGELVPSEMARRMENAGVSGFAITDHADFSNISWVMSRLRELQNWRDDYGVKILLGVEITHVPPKLIGKAVELAWKEGAEIVVVHGETLAEPVKEGTNEAAIESGANVLAHPGIVDRTLAEKAEDSGIYLEISARKGHCLGNGCVARLLSYVDIVVNTDMHSPSDIITPETAFKICLAAGISKPEVVLESNAKLFRNLWKAKK